MWRWLAIVLGAVLLYVVGLVFGGIGRVPFTEAKYYSRPMFDFWLVVFFLVIFWFLAVLVWKQIRHYGKRGFEMPRIARFTVSDPPTGWDWLAALATLASMFIGLLALLILAFLGSMKGEWADKLFAGVECGFWLFALAGLGGLVMVGVDLGFFASALGVLLTIPFILFLVALAYGLNKLTVHWVSS